LLISDSEREGQGGMAVYGMPSRIDRLMSSSDGSSPEAVVLNLKIDEVKSRGVGRK